MAYGVVLDGRLAAVLVRRRGIDRSAGAMVERFELQAPAGSCRPAVAREIWPAVELEVRLDCAGVELLADGERVTVGDGCVRWTPRPAPGRQPVMSVTVRPLRPAWHTAASPPAEAAKAELASDLEVETTATRWSQSVRSALADLSALRVHDADRGLRYVGAGAPWYMALFGRDALLTAWEALIAGPELGLDVLETLARFQGVGHDPVSGEQPGRILHELRTGARGVFGLPSGRPYYASVDASPLFVMLLGELWRWGADPDRVRGLLPAARAALAWCVEHGDVDGDGYVESVPDQHGLANLGWKDSPDSMMHADGSPAAQPVVLAEVQGYLYAAFEALAALEDAIGDAAEDAIGDAAEDAIGDAAEEAIGDAAEDAIGDAAGAAGLRAAAQRLRAAFLRDFWLPERGLVAMALDGAKRPLAVASTNPGHCLWAGLLDGEVGDALARRLTRPDLRTAWGLRTLASSERAYDPLSYHRGSVWPHDSALCAAGLARAGQRAAAAGLLEGLLGAAESFGWRLPELFAGLGEEQVPFPVPYPGGCSPQAWSAAVPLLALRIALGLEPDVPAGRVRLAPVLADDVELRVRGIRLGDGRLDLRARGGQVDVLGCPAGLRVLAG
jgi:glycogen debranching enzyme